MPAGGVLRDSGRCGMAGTPVGGVVRDVDAVLRGGSEPGFERVIAGVGPLVREASELVDARGEPDGEQRQNED